MTRSFVHKPQSVSPTLSKKVHAIQPIEKQKYFKNKEFLEDLNCQPFDHESIVTNIMLQNHIYWIQFVLLDESIEFFTLGLSDTFLSDYLTDLKVTQNKINFVKNCPQWGLNSQPPDHLSNALPTELSHYLIVCVNH